MAEDDWLGFPFMPPSEDNDEEVVRTVGKKNKKKAKKAKQPKPPEPPPSSKSKKGALAGSQSTSGAGLRACSRSSTSNAKADGGTLSAKSGGGVVGGQFAALLKSTPIKETKIKKRKASDAQDPNLSNKGNGTKSAATKKAPVTSDSRSTDGQRPAKLPKPPTPSNNQASLQTSLAPRSAIFRTVWLSQPAKVARGAGRFPGGAGVVEAAAACSARSDFESSEASNISADNLSASASSDAASWVVVALSAGEQLCGLGSVCVTCLHGRLDVSGLVLDGRDYRSNSGDSSATNRHSTDDGRGCTVTVHAAAWHGAVTLKALSKSDARSSYNDVIEPAGDSGIDENGRFANEGACSASGLSHEYPVHVLLETLPEGPAHNLLTCAGDGQDATRLAHGGEVLSRRRSLGRSGAADSNFQRSTTGAGTNEDYTGDSDAPVHATSKLALPGWCVLAGEEDEEEEGTAQGDNATDSSSSTSCSNHAAVAAQAARSTPVLAVPSSWLKAADAVVHAHLRHLSQTEASLLGGDRHRGSNSTISIEGMDDAQSLPEAPVVCLVVGAKGVGKSSAVRYLVHRLVSARRDWLRAILHPLEQDMQQQDLPPQLLSRVRAQAAGAWRATSVSLLDLDVGQPEMAPPGLLSLHTLDARLGSRCVHGGGESEQKSADDTEVNSEHTEGKEHGLSEATLLLGPPHTHLAPSCGGGTSHDTINSGRSDSGSGGGSSYGDGPGGGGAYFFGDVTPRRDPALYLAQVASLAASHRARLKQGPVFAAAVLADQSCDAAASAAGSGSSGTEAAELVAARARATLLACGLPLVANGDGWVSGLGSGVLASLLRLVRPSHVVALHGVGRNKQFTLPTQSNAAQDFLGPDAAAHPSTDPDAMHDNDAMLTSVPHEDAYSAFDNASAVVQDDNDANAGAVSAPPLWVPSRTVQHSSSGVDSSSAEVDSSEAESSNKEKKSSGTSTTTGVDCSIHRSTNGGMVWGEVHVVDAWNAAFTEAAAAAQKERTTSGNSDESNDLEGYDDSSNGDGGQAGTATVVTSPPNAVVAPTTSGSSAADLRSVRTAAYFALLFQQQHHASRSTHDGGNANAHPSSTSHSLASGVAVRNGALSDPSGSLAHALAEARPLRAPLQALALLAPGDLPGVPALASTTEVLHAFNGALVALLDHRPLSTVQADTQGSSCSAAHSGASSAVAGASSSEDHSGVGEEQLAPEDGGGWLPPPGARCVGLGIVRSIDLDRGGWVYLLTPAPASSLRRCAALARAPVGAGPGTSLSGLPPQLLLDPKASAFPYLFCEALTTGGGAIMKSRNNLLRGGNT